MRWQRTIELTTMVLGVVLAPIFLVIGLELFFTGADKQHIFKGIGLDPHWERAPGQSLLIVGAAILALAVITAQTVGHARRHRRSRTQPRQ